MKAQDHIYNYTKALWLVSGNTSQSLLFIWELVQSCEKKPKWLQTGSTANSASETDDKAILPLH